MAYVEATNGYEPYVVCEVCGRALRAGGRRGWRERHEGSERHVRHALLTRRAADGWVPLVGHASLMARRRGYAVEVERSAVHVQTRDVAWGRVAEAEDLALSLPERSPIGHTLRAILAAAAAVRAHGVPWRLAWQRAADAAAIAQERRPGWWVV